MFGDYERDEVECGLTHKDIRDGLKCPRAYLEVPPLDITPHPEFSRYLFSYMTYMTVPLIISMNHLNLK